MPSEIIVSTYSNISTEHISHKNNEFDQCELWSVVSVLVYMYWFQKKR